MMSVDSRSARRRRVLVPAGALILVLVFLLTACGTHTTTGAPAGGKTATATLSPIPGTRSCPGTAVVTAQPAPAGLILTNKDSGSTINVTRGETIEVNLPFDHAWSGPADLSPGLLTMQTPAGYTAPALGACVWRFTATGTGTVRLSFVGRPICEKGQVCPMYVMAVIFTLDIS
jgi:hypothetical protein